MNLVLSARSAEVSLSELVLVPSEALLDVLDILDFATHLRAVIVLKELLDGEVELLSSLLLSHVVEELIAGSIVELVNSVIVGCLQLPAFLSDLSHFLSSTAGLGRGTSDFLGGALVLIEDSADVLLALDNDRVHFNCIIQFWLRLLLVKAANKLGNEDGLLGVARGVAILSVSFRLSLHTFLYFLSLFRFGFVVF